MALRQHKKKIKQNRGDGSDGDGGDGITIHYMNPEEFEACYQQSALDRTQRCAQEATIKEQKELIAALQKSLEDKTKESEKYKGSSQEANEHRALCAAQVIQLEKEKNTLELDITALEDSHKSEVEALQQEAKAAEKKATDKLEDSRASYTQMKQGLEQQIYELQQQNENLRESTWVDIKVANESITSLQQSNQKLQLSIKQYSRAYGNLQQSSKKLQQSYETLQRSFQEKAVEMKAKAVAHEQLSLEHKKLQENLQTATDMINTRTSRICTLEQQYKEQQESSAAKYDKLQKEYELLEDDNKVKSDEVQSLKAEAVDVKKKIKTEMKVLQEKHQSISQHYESERTTLNDSIASLRKEKQTKELVSSCALFVLNFLSQHNTPILISSPTYAQRTYRK